MMGGSPPVEELLRDRSLVYVTGKGGSGKTTVAAALGIAAARRGRRTIVCELTGGAQLASAFGAADGAGRTIPLTENLWCSSVEPGEALREWLRRQPAAPSPTPCSAARTRSRVSSTPHPVPRSWSRSARCSRSRGVLRSGPSARTSWSWPTARRPVTRSACLRRRAASRRWRRGARSRHRLARSRSSWPIRAYQATWACRSPRRCRSASCSISSEASVTRRALARPGRRQRRLPRSFTDEEAERIEALAAGPRASGALAAALREHRRARSHARYVRWLRQRVHAPVITLPYSFSADIGPARYARWRTS